MRFRRTFLLVALQAASLLVPGGLVGRASAQAPADGKAAAVRPSIYDKNADAQVQLARATDLARRDAKRVLLMFGGDWCGWCHKLHGLFNTNPEIRRLLTNEYELVMIDTKAPHAQELLERCSQGQTGVGFPFLAVMDSAGKLLVGQKTDPLEEGDHHDPAKVREFLARWTAEPRDAQAVLRESLARAASEDRKVFLLFGAPWCGWCHRLEDFLARPEVAEVIARDFLVTKIDVDRMTHGKDVMEKYRSADARSGGIPWYAILDARGERLATSDALKGSQPNIGYPAEPREIDAFMGILEGQKNRIEAKQLDALRTALVSDGRKIMADLQRRAAEAKEKTAVKN